MCLGSFKIIGGLTYGRVFKKRGYRSPLSDVKLPIAAFFKNAAIGPSENEAPVKFQNFVVLPIAAFFKKRIAAFFKKRGYRSSINFLESTYSRVFMKRGYSESLAAF